LVSTTGRPAALNRDSTLAMAGAMRATCGKELLGIDTPAADPVDDQQSGVAFAADRMQASRHEFPVVW
jgi:hypothetical protein